MQVTTSEFRKTLGKFTTGVTVNTAIREDQRVHGMTADSFTFVSLEAFEILACVDRRGLTHGFVHERKNFGVNVPSEDQEALAGFFARTEQDPATAHSLGVEFHASGRGKPILKENLVQLDCKLASVVEAGDDTGFIGEVADMNRNDGRPFLFHAGHYNRVNAGG